MQWYIYPQSYHKIGVVDWTSGTSCPPNGRTAISALLGSESEIWAKGQFPRKVPTLSCVYTSTTPSNIQLDSFLATVVLRAHRAHGRKEEERLDRRLHHPDVDLVSRTRRETQKGRRGLKWDQGHMGVGRWLKAYRASLGCAPLLSYPGLSDCPLRAGSWRWNDTDGQAKTRR